MKGHDAYTLLESVNPVSEELIKEWAASQAAEDLAERIMSQPLDLASIRVAPRAGRLFILAAVAAPLMLAVTTALALSWQYSPPGSQGSPTTVVSAPLPDDAPPTTATSGDGGSTPSSVPVSPQQGAIVRGMNYLARQIADADVIVWGRVTLAETPRWNSPDGLEWHGTSDEDMPIVYTTYVVEPAEIWKGSEWSGALRFMVPGGVAPGGGSTSTVGSLIGTGLAVGDEVVLFGAQKPAYSAPEPHAYWLLHGLTSVYRRDGSFLERVEPITDDPDGNLHSLEGLRTLVAGD